MKSLKRKLGLKGIEDAKGSVGQTAANTGIMLVTGAVGAIAGTYVGSAGMLVGAAIVVASIATGHAELAGGGVGMFIGSAVTSVPDEVVAPKTTDGKDKSFLQKFHEKGMARLKVAGKNAKETTYLSKLLDKKTTPVPVVPAVPPSTLPVKGINSLRGVTQDYRMSRI